MKQERRGTIEPNKNNIKRKKTQNTSRMLMSEK